MTSSVFSVVWFWLWNKLPNIGIRASSGTSSVSLSMRSSINPPSTAVWLFSIFSTESISRVDVWGTELVKARFGVGSSAGVRRRVMDGRTLSKTVSLSLICGVTLIVKPIGMVLTVVVYAVGAMQGAG